MNKILNFKKGIAALCFIAFAGFASAQDGYNIKVTFKGLKEGTLKLAYHMGNKQYLADSAVVNSKGVGVFKGDEKLKHGIYLIADPDRNYFEVLIHEDQHFEVTADYSKPVNGQPSEPYSRSVDFKGSELNVDYYSYQKMLDTVGTRLYQIDTTLKNPSRLTEDEVNALKKEKKELYDYRNGFQNAFIDRKPESFLSTLFLFNKGIDWPEGSETWSQSDKYYYYREHFFDNANLNEDGLVRTPFFIPKVDQYYALFKQKEADTIVEYTDRIIERSAGAPELFKYFVRHTLNTFDTTKRVCMEGVYVNVALKYYATGRAFWVSDTLSDEITERAMKMKDIICDKIAPNIILDQYGTGKKVQLHQIKSKITILVFWTPDCSHCRHEIPEFFELFKQYADSGVKVYAACTEIQDEGLEKWRNFIKEKGLIHPNWYNMAETGHNPYFKYIYNIQSTPTFFLLDENKKIILRRIGVETLKYYFEQEFGAIEKEDGTGSSNQENHEGHDHN